VISGCLSADLVGEETSRMYLFLVDQIESMLISSNANSPMATSGGAVLSRAVAAPATERALPPPAENSLQVQALLGKRAAPGAVAGALEGSNRLRLSRLDDACHGELSQREARGGAREGDSLSARAAACTSLMSSASGVADAHSDETGGENKQLGYECVLEHNSGGRSKCCHIYPTLPHTPSTVTNVGGVPTQRTPFIIRLFATCGSIFTA
jgi:hypothetical protein